MSNHSDHPDQPKNPADPSAGSPHSNVGKSQPSSDSDSGAVRQPGQPKIPADPSAGSPHSNVGKSQPPADPNSGSGRQSGRSDSSADPAHTADPNSGSGSSHGRSDSSADPHPHVTPQISVRNSGGLHRLQATQLEHKSGNPPIFDSIGPLAGRDKSPQTPSKNSPTEAAKDVSQKPGSDPISDSTSPSSGGDQSPRKSAEDSPPQAAKSVEHKSGSDPISDSTKTPPKAAKKMEHKSEDKPPISDSKSPPKAAKKTAQNAAKKPAAKRRDNHISFRAKSAEFDIIAERIKRTGETQSEAVRNIIIESASREGNVYLAPRTHPKQLEEFLRELASWRKSLYAVKMRINIPIPDEVNDPERHKEVQDWRRQTGFLLYFIDQLEKTVVAALNTVTSLTPQKVEILEKSLVLLPKWQKQFHEKKQEKVVEMIQVIVEMIKDAGITPNK